MNTYRATRFLIDRIDRRLGSVEKEIKFDKAVILWCLVVILLELMIIMLCAVAPFLVGPAMVGVIFAAFAIFLIPVMTRELKADREKAERKRLEA